MSRHFKKEEFDKIFEIYSSEGTEKALYFMKEIEPKLIFIKSTSLRNRLKKIVSYYNLNMENQLLTKSGSQRKPGSGRPKKDKKSKVPNFEKFTRQDLIIIATRYYEIAEKMDKNQKKNESHELEDLSQTKTAEILDATRQTISKWKTNSISKKEEKYEQYREIILKVFYENKQVYGRVKMSIVLREKYGIYINYRTLGRIMKYLNIKSFVRNKKKVREKKNTKFQKEDLVKRDFNDKDSRGIIATDVTYIPAPADLKPFQNHIFLSAIIEHKTKRILGYSISTKNDLKLVIDNFKNIKDFNRDSFIIHSDHGYQYTSKYYIDMIERKNGKVSFSRVGNSLDNREIEYWFSCLKSEWLKRLIIQKLLSMN
ncbi:DDE-type integrase/transposase/recombinase [Mycoplasma sp. 6243]|uniref:DDE-type integrase/transposase/recombinase n=1 Tax=Mycoplasma sp. 6243 TaxID=3440865 RepID=UPI003EBA1B33